MSNLDPIENGYAETDKDNMYFVESLDGLRNLIRDFESDEDSDPADVDSDYVESVIYDIAKLPFPRIVALNTVFACRADGCRNGEEDEDYTEIVWSFSLIDTIDMTAQFSLRGYS